MNRLGSISLVSSCLLLLLTHCVDQQSSALKALAGKGYSLSVPEFFKAAAAGDAAVLKLFIEAGVELDVRDKDGRQALNHAARAGSPEGIEALVNLGATVPQHSSLLLSDAVRSHAMPSLQALLDLKVKPDADPRDSPLSTAASENQREMIEALLPLCLGHLDNALLAAAAQGDISVVSTLMRAGASVFIRDAVTQRTPLMEAAGHGDVKVVTMLLDSGANRWAVDAEGFTTAEKAEAALHADLARDLRKPPTEEERRVAPSIKGKSFALRPEFLDKQLFFTGCRETLLPFMLVTSEVDTATVQLAGEQQEVKLALGAPVPSSLWKLERLKPEGAIFRKGDTTEHLLLVPGLPARHGPLVAVIQDDSTKQTYEAAAGDMFNSETDPALKLSVKAVSPHEVRITDNNSPAREWILHLGGRRW